MYLPLELRLKPYKSFTAILKYTSSVFVLYFASMIFCIKTLRILHSRNLDNVNIYDVLLLKKVHYGPVTY